MTWIEGTSSVLPDASFDIAVMTSHVAQFFVTDAAWATALADLARALVPDGRLVFDARDPDDHAWERWPEEWHRTVALPSGVAVEQSIEVTEVAGAVVSHTIRCRFDDGVELDSSASLRFRTADELRTSLAGAGFTVDRMFGGWAREPVGAGDGELLVMARRREMT